MIKTAQTETVRPKSPVLAIYGSANLPPWKMKLTPG